ncbi:ribosome silencing factor [Schaalia hyovaginalis]|uniref:ribosome silencing factor n=1 Tax=Schaalia hyovaginalis TaxID=29316 RepID=UPI001F1C6249|nr:ribosome silencing factor [Schaalia hyovaginalis]
MLTSDLVDVAAKAAFDKLALNPVLVNVADRLAIAESFLIASASSERQVRAIGEEILDRVADELGVEPDHIEGRTGNRWILLDYGELVVHVLLDEERDFYRLENLWSDGAVVPLEDPALSDPVRERLGA